MCGLLVPRLRNPPPPLFSKKKEKKKRKLVRNSKKRIKTCIDLGFVSCKLLNTTIKITGHIRQKKKRIPWA